MIERDISNDLQAIVVNAKADKMQLLLQGGGSKRFYGTKLQGEAIDLTGHQGIVNYQPSELVVTARAGTSIRELQAVLAEQGQMLAFEPAEFEGKATLGGAIAWGLSGPRRPFTGSARDFVLGCRLINGKAEITQFGGEVIKNVAGYDISRLMVGAMGTLGILLDISLKVLPLPEIEETVCFDLDEAAALEKMQSLSALCLPLSGLCYEQSRLYVRLSGSENTVRAAVIKLGGELLSNSQKFWTDIREYQNSFFQQQGELWRFSVPPASPVSAIPGQVFYDWGGALRWLKTDADAETLFDRADKLGGHATLFRSDNNILPRFHPLPSALMQLQYRIKQAFDPDDLFNPCRLYQVW